MRKFTHTEQRILDSQQSIIAQCDRREAEHGPQDVNEWMRSAAMREIKRIVEATEVFYPDPPAPLPRITEEQVRGYLRSAGYALVDDTPPRESVSAWQFSSERHNTDYGLIRNDDDREFHHTNYCFLSRSKRFIQGVGVWEESESEFIARYHQWLG